MDSDDTRNQKLIIAIKENLRSGTITPAEIDGRLTALIENEMRKTDGRIDAELVCACEDLLWELHARETAQIESHREKQWENIQAYLKKTTPIWRVSKRAARIVAVAAAVLVLFVLGDGILRRQWLVKNQSADEQQLILQGKVFNPGLVSEGVASQDGEVQELSTSDLYAVAEFLGFAPPMPAYVPEGWVLDFYHAVQLPNSVSLMAAYKEDGNPEYLLYEFKRYLDVKYARDEIEQNQRGELVEIGDGRRVYVAKNIGSTVCAWVERLDFYYLSAPLEQDVLVEIIKAIQ